MPISNNDPFIKHIAYGNIALLQTTSNQALAVLFLHEVVVFDENILLTVVFSELI